MKDGSSFLPDDWSWYDDDPAYWPINPYGSINDDLDVWVTKSGKVIKILDMEDLHLVNTLAFLLRRDGNFKHKKIKPILAELARRAELSLDSK